MKFLVSLLLVAGCASLKSRQPAHATAQMDSAPLPWVDISHDEDSHLLVDTQVPDEEISKTTGGDIDATESVEESYSPRPFLKRIKTKRVKFWIDYFTSKQRDRFQRFINNGMKYKPIIDKILDAEELPRELFFVGLIESGYYLGAHSRASAVGPWQFIRGTGHRYGLVMNADMDERRDIFKATLAAAQYFKDLNNIFSSWELALAAYNAGEYGIIRRIQRYKTRDYYELSRTQKIPSETINYVPKVLAAMYVFENAQKYGFTLPQNHEFWEKTKTVAVAKGASLDGIAKKLNLNTSLLVELNPELKGKITPRTYPGPYEIRVPAGKNTEWMETYVAEAPQESSRIKEIVALRDKVENPQNYPLPAPVQTKIHVVRRGESLTLIARKYKMSVGELAQMNRISWRSHVRIGQRLTLSRSTRTIASTPSIAPPERTKSLSIHKVIRGENLSVIARKYQLSLKEIALLNGLTVRSQVRIGQVLKVEKGVIAQVTPKVSKRETPIVYKLRPGETLTDVARWFETDVNSLKKVNNISRGRALHVGTKIKIPETKKGIYRVKRGDYLIKIAQKFNLNQTALMKLNNIKNGKVYPGQRLVVNLE